MQIGLEVEGFETVRESHAMGAGSQVDCGRGILDSEQVLQVGVEEHQAVTELLMDLQEHEKVVEESALLP